jgi:hypothetical protein
MSFAILKEEGRKLKQKGDKRANQIIRGRHYGYNIWYGFYYAFKRLNPQSKEHFYKNANLAAAKLTREIIGLRPWLCFKHYLITLKDGMQTTWRYYIREWGRSKLWLILGYWIIAAAFTCLSALQQERIPAIGHEILALISIAGLYALPQMLITAYYEPLIHRYLLAIWVFLWPFLAAVVSSWIWYCTRDMYTPAASAHC